MGLGLAFKRQWGLVEDHRWRRAIRAWGSLEPWRELQAQEQWVSLDGRADGTRREGKEGEEKRRGKEEVEKEARGLLNYSRQKKDGEMEMSRTRRRSENRALAIIMYGHLPYHLRHGRGSGPMNRCDHVAVLYSTYISQWTVVYQYFVLRLCTRVAGSGSARGWSPSAADSPSPMTL